MRNQVNTPEQKIEKAADKCKWKATVALTPILPSDAERMAVRYDAELKCCPIRAAVRHDNAAAFLIRWSPILVHYFVDLTGTLRSMNRIGQYRGRARLDQLAVMATNRGMAE